MIILKTKNVPGIWNKQGYAWYKSVFVTLPQTSYPTLGIGCYEDSKENISLLEIEYLNKIPQNEKGDIEVKFHFIKKLEIQSNDFLNTEGIYKPLLQQVNNTILIQKFDILKNEIKNYELVNDLVELCQRDIEFSSETFLFDKNQHIYNQFKGLEIPTPFIDKLLFDLQNHSLGINGIGLNDFIKMENLYPNELIVSNIITGCCLLMKAIDIKAPWSSGLLSQYDELTITGIAHVGRPVGYQIKTYLEFKKFLNGNSNIEDFTTNEKSLKNALLYFENPTLYTNYLSEKGRKTFYEIFTKNTYESKNFNTIILDKLLQVYNKKLVLKNRLNYGALYSKFIYRTLPKEVVEKGGNLLPNTNSQEIPNSFRNIILYGPPGTGKTYHSIDKAVEIATGFSKIHEENKKIFDQLKKDGQIEFITFHQNYSYEDFVVGIKPDPENELLRFISHKGIFYEIAKRARENYFASNNDTHSVRSFMDAFEEIIKPLESGQNVKIKMASGIFYTITDVTDSSIRFQKPSGDSVHTLSIQTLESIVEGTRVFISGLGPYYNPLAEIIVEKRKSFNNTVREKLKNFVLIIDEINRANISKVFGELITLLEEDKRIGNKMELKVTLPNKEEFSLPPNLYIIGTMNTADKSIALIDIALRRRFEFLGYYPLYEGYDTESADLLKKINSAIYDNKKSADYLIGHAYFMQNLPIELVLQNKIIPLLMEYFSNKTEIVSRLFDNTGWEISYNSNTYNWNIKKL